MAASQELGIVLDSRVCISTEAIRARMVVPAEPKPDPSIATISVFADGPKWQSGTFRFRGDHSSDATRARDSQMSLRPGCDRFITIHKTFDPGYWNYVCPLTYDRNFIDTVITPALRAQTAPGAGEYNLAEPEIDDWGSQLKLTFRETHPAPPRHDWQAFRLSLIVDRCSRSVSGISKYIP
jgi:hypothetical protein